MRSKLLFLSMLLSLLCPACIAQTDVAASLYGAFNESTTGDGVQQSPSNSAGALLELRHIRNPLVGYEVTYSYNRANQVYSPTEVAVPAACPTSGCASSYTQSASISNNAHEVSGDWLISLKVSSFRPFALAGGGILLNEPSGGTVTGEVCSVSGCQAATTAATTSSSAKGVFVYGAGLDWTVLPHLGLRFQYRGDLYKASALTTAFSSTNAFTHTAEPMIGAFLRF